QTDNIMKLGIVLPYSGADMSFPIDRVLEAERLGFDSVWTSEAYGSDAVTPAAWVLARTYCDNADAGTHPRHDGDDCDDARRALGRSFCLGYRAVRPTGGGGLARCGLRQATPAHPRVH